jgi:hypothetical protein
VPGAWSSRESWPPQASRLPVAVGGLGFCPGWGRLAPVIITTEMPFCPPPSSQGYYLLAAPKHRRRPAACLIMGEAQSCLGHPARTLRRRYTRSSYRSEKSLAAISPWQSGFTSGKDGQPPARFSQAPLLRPAGGTPPGQRQGLNRGDVTPMRAMGLGPSGCTTEEGAGEAGWGLTPSVLTLLQSPQPPSCDGECCA